MFVDGEGGIVMLDRDEKTVRVYDETGKLLRTRGPGTGLQQARWTWPSTPSATSTSPTRRLGVLVFSPQGQLLATLAGPELRKPKALTLDPAGAVLVYDDKAEKMLQVQDEGEPAATLLPAASVSCLGLSPRPPLARCRSAGAAGPRAPGRPGQRARSRPPRTSSPGPRRSSKGRSRAGPSCCFDEIIAPPGGPASARGHCPRAGATSWSRPTSCAAARTSTSASRRRPRPSFRPLVQLKPDYTLSTEKVSPKVVELFNLGEEGARRLPGGVLDARRGPGHAHRGGERRTELGLTDFFPLEVLAGEYTVEITRRATRRETRDRQHRAPRPPRRSRWT